MDDRKVTERDFRRPEFRDADPKDYEFRADGAVVRKDRWETAVHSIRFELSMSSREFEIPEVIQAVRDLVMKGRPFREVPDGWQHRIVDPATGNYFAPDGTLMNADGTRSIFDDVDQ